MPRTAGSKNINKIKKETEAKQELPVVKNEKSKTSFFDFLRFGESYTSLILGIVVVIISTVLLLSFVHNKNISRKNTIQVATQQNQDNSKKLALQNSQESTVTPTPQIKLSPTVVPTKTIVKNIQKPTLTPTPKIQQKNLAKPTIVPTKTIAKALPTQAKLPTAVPTLKKIAVAKQNNINNPKETVYTITAGDTLWSIAEKQYKSGYNWVDIARANNLNDPNAINAGNKLVLPKVESKIATVNSSTNNLNIVSNQEIIQSQTSNNPVKITSSSYTVSKGDNLWTIAVRAYGDGYQWVKIAQANNLINPSVIHSGNNLKIPRA